MTCHNCHGLGFVSLPTFTRQRLRVVIGCPSCEGAGEVLIAPDGAIDRREEEVWADLADAGDD